MNTSKIKLKSRYNDIYHLTSINDTDYKFEGSGGPMLQVGDLIGNKKIEKN